MRTLNFTIDEEFSGKRLIDFLRGKLSMSSRIIKSLKHFDDGFLKNGEHVRTIDPLSFGDLITINLHENCSPPPVGQTLPDVVFFDNDVLVLNKPPLLPIHESHNHQGDTLSNEASLFLSQHGITTAFRAVGRLDKGTGGLVVCALTEFGAGKLSKSVKKEYLAVCEGEFFSPGTIDLPIFRPDERKTIRTVDPRGQRAVTHFFPLLTKNGRTLLRVVLDTGRTHQIRVHFSSIGAPLVGDTMYGKKSDQIAHQALFCYKVTFTHPVTGEEKTFFRFPNWEKLF